MTYLDHAAATPVSTKVLTAMTPYFAENFFNPSAPYLPAVEIRKIYDSAKNDIAHVIGGKGIDLVITAGATESINLAFTAAAPQSKVLISAAEHPAVTAAAEKHGNFVIIQTDQHGRVLLDDLAAKLTTDVQFVSVCLASSTLGTIQPLSEISTLVKAERQRRLSSGDKTPIYLHCDASQGIGLIDAKVSRLGVDLLTLNSAKIYGPKGVGALWRSTRVKLHPLIVGGGQEMGLRSGTENVPGVIGFATAMQEAEKHLAANRKQIQTLRDLLRQELSQNPAIEFLGHPKHQLVNFLPINLPGLDAERLMFKLESQQVYVSTGTACAAAKNTKNSEGFKNSLRLTLGKLNTATNIKHAAHLILKAVEEESSRVGGVF